MITQDQKDDFSVAVTDDFNVLMDSFLNNDENATLNFETFLFAIKDDLKGSYLRNQRQYIGDAHD